MLGIVLECGLGLGLSLICSGRFVLIACLAYCFGACLFAGCGWFVLDWTAHLVNCLLHGLDASGSGLVLG